MRTIATIIVLLGTLNLFGQDGTFQYDNQIIVKYAITALEEFNAHITGTSKELKSEYELDNSTSYGRIMKDCEGEKVRVVMVVFPSKNEDGHASVSLTYSEDNQFGMILNREYSIQTGEEAIEGFKNSDFGDFLFGCGL